MSLKQRLGFTQEPIYVMDGNAFLFRGYFANSRMTRTDGFPTGALFIVGRVLLKLLDSTAEVGLTHIKIGFQHSQQLQACSANGDEKPNGNDALK